MPRHTDETPVEPEPEPAPEPTPEPEVPAEPEPEVPAEPEPVAYESGTLLGHRTRRVQSGSTTHDIVQGEPVDVPDDLVDSWIEMGWIERVQ